MDPMKIITYIAITAVVALVALGGLGFYLGTNLGDRFSPTAGSSAASDEALTEIRSLNQQVTELKEALAERRDTSQEKEDALAESQARLAKMADELDATERELEAAREEASQLRARLDQQSGEVSAAATTPAQAGEQRTAAATATPDDSVMLYDRFQLEREAARDFDDVDLRFGLQTVGSRSAGLSVNGKRISMQVKDGKQIIHKGVTCELILLDTDQTVQRAQFSLACKR